MLKILLTILKFTEIRKYDKKKCCINYTNVIIQWRSREYRQ